MTKEVSNPTFGPLECSVHRLLGNLEEHGFVALAWLHPGQTAVALEAANKFEFVKRPDHIGDRQIRQDVWAAKDFMLPGDDLFLEMAKVLQESLTGIFQDSQMKDYSFSMPQEFNAAALLRYQPGGVGMAPHLDPYTHCLTAIVLLEGPTALYVCDDAEGNNRRPVENARPGSVILMRATGFTWPRAPKEVRMYHGVDPVDAQRTAVVFSQIQ